MPYEFTITPCIHINGPHMEHPVFVPPESLIDIDGHGRFIHVANKLVSSVQLFADKNVRGERIMSKTDIITEITRRRDEKVEAMVGRLTFLEKTLLDNKSSRKRDVLYRKRKRVECPPVIEVDCPRRLGSDDGTYQMIVKGTLRKNAPLYISLTSDNLEYVREWVDHQLKEGSKKRVRVSKNVQPKDIEVDHRVGEYSEFVPNHIGAEAEADTDIAVDIEEERVIEDEPTDSDGVDNGEDEPIDSDGVDNGEEGDKKSPPRRRDLRDYFGRAS